MALYHTDDLSPSFTFPRMVALGATKSVYYKYGLAPL